ncbi:ABC transporter [Streptococcus cuniculi]|uniref:Transport permease protein n=1 Tax=Streptococcus cuniculi TaxID=1432788 RepID=A0A1Q8E618_9STRE|nr:ABC transporter permease [Streptococcus cuniculi]OLF47227.1 ABC transporter [Streptococcus cuniculi]
MEAIARFFRRIIIAYKQASMFSDWKTYLLFDLIPPISQTLFFSLIAYAIYGPAYIRKWMIGNALLIASFTALFGVGTQLMAEKYHGTLSFLIASKTRLSAILLSSTVSAMCTGMVSVVLGTSLVSVMLGISWNRNLILSFVVVLILATFVAMSFGYLFSCFILVTSEVNLVLNLATRVLLMFTGANFPIAKLPPLLQGFSNLLPLTRSIHIAQGLMEGYPLSHYRQLIQEEVLLGLCFLLVASILLSFMETKARKDSTIELI